MNRKSFLRMAAGVAAMPLFNIGCAGFGQGRARQIAKGAKIRVALIGCGFRMREMILADTSEQVVAVVEPDAPRRRDFIARVKKTPNAANIEGVREYDDYHPLFEEMGDSIDAVVICTSNRHHAPAAIMAMNRGIHVFVEKPMAYTVREAQIMGRIAKKMGVVTQVGNFGHSTRAMKVCVEALQAGVLGDITEVWAYTDRVNAMGHRPKPVDPPKDMDWNSWCGPAELCGYYGPQKPHLFGLHPHDWHSWQKLGNGSIGNMGTHVMDAPFWALNLGAAHPTSIHCTHADIVAEGSWSIRTEMEYEFPEVGNRGPVKMHWTDGLRYGLDYEAANLSNYGYAKAGRKDHNMPEIMHKLERDYHLEKAPFATNGAFFKGTKGYAWYGQHSMVRFFPKSLGQDIRKFTGANAIDHMGEFFKAIREGRQANTGFEFSVPLGETVLLGNVGILAAGKKLLWDGTHITNDAASDARLETTYRKGWELEA